MMQRLLQFRRSRSTSEYSDRENLLYAQAEKDESDSDYLYDRSTLTTPSSNSIRRALFFPYVLHFVVLCTYSLLFYDLLSSQGKRHEDLGIPYVDRTFEINPRLNQSTARFYTGPPSEELTEAWSKLLQYGNIRVPEKKIKELGRLHNSVKFTDGSGYYGQMTVYHHLHCIKRLHHYLHRDHYWPNATENEKFLLRAHNYHCLDTLRQAIMCQGDTSLVTFRWGHTQAIPVANWSTPHHCRDWSALDTWNRKHYVNVFEPGLVVHPKLGPSYKTTYDGYTGIGVGVDS